MTKPFQITEDVYQSMSIDDGGFCTNCRSEAYGIEPDARKIKCEVCEKNYVFGIEELLMMGKVELI